MKNILFACYIMLCSPFLAYCQSNPTHSSTKLDNSIYSGQFEQSKSKLLHFVKENKLEVLVQKEFKTKLIISFNMPSQLFPAFETLQQQLGYSKSKDITATSHLTKANKLQLELQYFNEKRNSYQQLMSRLDTTSENYLVLWNEYQIITTKIFETESKLVALSGQAGTYEINIKLYDELASPEYSEISFVNMPGIEYSVLKVAAPAEGISASNYKGIFLKYLFTRGKSFGTVGLYRNTTIGKTDAKAFSELFLLGFGQDFYSRYLGRGNWKFLNLYSGYVIGGMFASSEESNSTLFYLSPTLGLELFKNKFLLIDTKASYLVPLKHTRNLRGFSVNASINFVF